MSEFINETIDINSLPKFEAVPFTSLNTSYWKIILINKIILVFLLGLSIAIAFYFIEELRRYRYLFLVSYFVFVISTIFLSRIAFKKKGYAFRTHDVLFKNGILSNNTIVIPFNRIQHVALQEGFVSKHFGLARIEIYTAGGSSSDIEIPGITKAQAENIQLLLMGKIQNQN